MSTLLLLTMATVGQTWTVDDDGPADFSDLPPAVAAVAPGDVLLVSPGTYLPPTLDKDLTILASPTSSGLTRPRVLGEFTVDGAPSFTLVGLEFNNLVIDGVSGRGRVDDCLVTGSFDTGIYGTFVIVDCAQVEVVRTDAFGDSGTFFNGTGALHVRDSRVSVVDCNLVGPPGLDDPIRPDAGYAGIYAYGITRIELAGCNVTGGDGGDGLPGPAPGEPAIRGYSGTFEVNIRGSSTHVIAGGFTGGFAGTQAAAVKGIDVLTYSGVSMQPGPPFGGTRISPPEPYLAIGGLDLPGGYRRVRVYGPDGATALLALASTPALFDLPGLPGGSVWLNPGTIFLSTTVALVGQDVGATYTVLLPSDATLAGFKVEVAALVLDGPTGLYLTNPDQVTLRF